MPPDTSTRADRSRPAATVHRPVPGLLRAALFAAPAARAAGTVSLERHRKERLGRLLEVGAGALGQRRRPTRPRMRSLVLRGGARLAWHDIAVPAPPGPLGAVVAPLAMATCDLDRPVGLGATPFPFPLHFGHECVGEVCAVGDDVRSVAVGDRVVVPFQISCGACRACRAGLTGNCRRLPPLSMYGFGVVGGAWGGVFAEQVAVPFADAMLVPLPAGVDPITVASAGDTLSDAFRHIHPHVDRVRQHPDGPRILIVGSVRREHRFSASVPLYAAQVAKALVPEAEVIVVDARDHVRAHAERLGVTAASTERLRHLKGALVLDSSADPRGLAAALRATAPDGVCSCAGTLHASARVPAAQMFGRNVTLTIARSHVRGAIPGVLDLVKAGRIHPERVTTTVASFDEAPAALRAHLLGADTKTVLTH